MTDRLDQFLKICAARPFVWGVSDCGLMLADWWAFNGHGDPASHLRGRYGDQDGCERLLEAEGGLHAVVAGIAERLGLPRLEKPERGCVGVLGMRGRQFGAIFAGRMWLIHGSAGLIGVTARAGGMWRV